MDLSALTSAIDLKTVGAAILAVGALKAAPIILEWASVKVLGFLKRG
ncbi:MULTISPECIES: hypothetical protein [Paracidovorax]|nr:hypothetical protein [Paracidovorax avenae]